ncbi:MAG TPA: hypothetical protein VMZ00_18460 [Sporichthya sp.]|nr:hypothetical protein [Sporichthya sp.]
MDLDQEAYGEADPADTDSGVGYALSMVEVARYWSRRTAGATRPNLAAEVAEAREARRLTEILTALGEVSSPLAPLEVLEVGAPSDWTANALRRLGFRVESTGADPAQVTSPWLFDLVLAPDALRGLADDARRDAALNLASLVRLGGRLVTDGPAAAYAGLLEPRGLRLDGGEHDVDDDNPGALFAWTRES